jgi:hypothetical protein
MVKNMGIKIIAWRTSLPNCMTIYQVIQEISTHDLYLKLATPLLGFPPTVKKNSSACHGNITDFTSFLPYSKLHTIFAIVTLATDFI